MFRVFAAGPHVALRAAAGAGGAVGAGRLHRAAAPGDTTRRPAADPRGWGNVLQRLQVLVVPVHHQVSHLKIIFDCLLSAVQIACYYRCWVQKSIWKTFHFPKSPNFLSTIFFEFCQAYTLLTLYAHLIKPFTPSPRPSEEEILPPLPVQLSPQASFIRARRRTLTRGESYRSSLLKRRRQENVNVLSPLAQP